MESRQDCSSSLLEKKTCSRHSARHSLSVLNEGRRVATENRPSRRKHLNFEVSGATEELKESNGNLNFVVGVLIKRKYNPGIGSVPKTSEAFSVRVFLQAAVLPPVERVHRLVDEALPLVLTP